MCAINVKNYSGIHNPEQQPMKTHKKMPAGFAAPALKRNAGAAALAILVFSLPARAQSSEQIYFGGVSSSAESAYLNRPSN